MLIDAGYLDGDVALNEQMDAIAAEVTSNENDITGFPCIHCEKVCKTQHDLSQDIPTIKHANVSETEKLSPTPLTPLEVSMKKLHPVKLRVTVKMCAENIATDLCFPVSTRTKFSRSFMVQTQRFN